MAAKPVGVGVKPRCCEMTQNKRDTARTITRDRTGHDGMNPACPHIIALDQVISGELYKAGGKFRGGQCDKDDTEHKDPDWDQDAVPCRTVAHLHHRKDREAAKRNNKAAARMALEQGKGKDHGKGQPSALLIEHLAKAHLLLPAKAIKTGKKAKDHQCGKGVTVGNASGPVADMCGFGKPECRLPSCDLVQRGKPDLKGGGTCRRDADLFDKAVGVFARKQGCQRQGCDKPQDIGRCAVPCGGVKGDVIGVKWGGLRGPDGQGLHDHPARDQTRHQPDDAQITREIDRHFRAQCQDANPGQNRQNPHGPWPRPAQQQRGQNDLGQKTKLRHPKDHWKHRTASIWFGNKDLSVSEKLHPVAFADHRVVRWVRS